MNSPNLRFHSLCQRLCLGLLAIVFVAASGLLSAAPGARKLLKIEISKDRSVAEVKVPAGYGSVTLQKFKHSGGWEKVASKEVKPGIVKFRLPSADKDIRWRAIGRLTNGSASHGKFPAAFYRGKNAFGAQKNSSAAGGLLNGAVFRDLSIGGDLAPETDSPVEADIWKTDGKTVYFFNQLRGLQVLDVSNPADPRLTASLRLPAVGEDLYLLPSSGSAANLVLLTQKPSGDSPVTRINLVKVDGGKVEITHRRDVPGQLTDSRMVGNRLIVATTEWNTVSIDAEVSGADVSSSHLSQWTITPGQALQDSGKFDISGDYPLIAAGADWLAVAVTPSGMWNRSDVTVFGLEKSGLVKLTPQPIRTAGLVADKFKMQWRDNVLTTISEKNKNEGEWSPTTVLENFRVWGANVIHPMVIEGRIGRLELAEGESLYATRFAGDKAYVVTFLQTDPLWVVDLSDPKNPVVAGELEVPGWSSYLEPIGDQLLSIGWESDSIAASLFDVSNPAAPKLLRRLDLGGGYSEASWDEQALKVLPEDGLAMIPLTSYDDASGETSSVVQLLDLDIKGGDLKLRGTIQHEFDARRSDLIGNAVISISQRVLVAADVSDRDKPSILSEVALAWPVDRVLDAGPHLIHIEDGSGYGYGRATARVSPAGSPEAVVSETDLGKGTVRGADLRDGKLFVLRETGSSRAILFRSPITGKASDKLVLDIYDATALPALSRISSVSKRISSGMSVVGGGLLWPRANRPTVVLDAMSSFWFGWNDPIMTGEVVSLKSAARMPSAESAIAVDRFPFWRPRKAPRLLVFDTTDASAPTAGEPVPVGTLETIPNGIYQAADGLVVMGTSNYKNEVNGATFAAGKALNAVHVTEIGESGDPVVRPAIDLPGELFAVSDLDRDGFLAFTRTYENKGEPALKASACDGFDAYEIAGLDVDAGVVATAGKRRLFIATAGGVDRHRLNDEGEFVSEGKLEVGWKPQELRWTSGLLLGSKWNSLFAAGPKAEAADTWRFPTWSLSLDRVSVAADGDLLAPFGDYGAERLQR